MNEKFPVRKPNRLKNYDYSRPGAYFITICTANRQNYFWSTVGARIARPQDVVLSSYGEIADQAIRNIPCIYPTISVDYYSIMPNHIHLLLQIHARQDGRAMRAPTTFPSIDTVICQMKGYISKRIGRSIWQKLYHDHVVRGRDDYEEIAKYIYENPLRWQEDCFYNE